MPTFTEVGPEARERLVRKGKGYQDRAGYRDMLSQVGGGKTFEVRPEGDETPRRLKVNISRAAKELGLEDIRYGETEDGALLVWSEDGQARRARRGRPRRVTSEGAD
jgi:hypothetical protein